MRLEKRKATAADTAYAREVHHAAYREVVIAQFGEWDEGVQDGFFASDWRGASFDILLWDGEVCGYTAVEERPDDMFVRELVIDPKFQGRGIGTALLRTVMERAVGRGVPVRLGALHRNRALKLYERLGFREFERTGTHVLMEWVGRGKVKVRS